MRCRVGDLAVIRGLRIDTQDNGRLVEVLAIIPEGPLEWEDPSGVIHNLVTPAPSVGVVAMGSPFVWDGAISCKYAIFRAANVFPIRDPGDDATDEMVLIAGKPQEVTA